MDKLSAHGRRSAVLLGLFLLGGCAGLGPGSRPGTERDIPAGRTLVRSGLAALGTAVGISDDPATCRAPEAWKAGASDMRLGASGPPWEASTCPLVTAQLAPDGSTLAIYDYSDGKARLFDLAEDGFVLAGTATISSQAVFGFPPPGRNVALAAGGQKLLLGSINHGCRTSDGIRVCGSAQLFERRDGEWRSVAALLPPADEDGLTRFGQSVALSSDASLALVGGTGEPGVSGALWVYALGQGAPKLLQRLSAEAAENGFANDLALSSDGTWLAVGGE